MNSGPRRENSQQNFNDLNAALLKFCFTSRHINGFDMSYHEPFCYGLVYASVRCSNKKANLLRSGDGMIDEDGKSGGHDGGCVLRVIGEVGVGAGGGGVGDWGIGGGIYKASAVGRGGLGGLAELVDFGFLGGLVVGWFLGGGAVEVRRGVGGGLVVDGSVPDGTAHILLCGAKAGCTGRGNQRGGREGRLRGKY
ncbi:hypothetical protein Tco_1122924 [Tanacetum coccineum]|uniref:Uncharacterized protein n=1 Tax=Tanacetum coccineum TaxID=301880 RepID=A0ABQ5J5L9_9ASTR